MMLSIEVKTEKTSLFQWKEELLDGWTRPDSLVIALVAQQNYNLRIATSKAIDDSTADSTDNSR